MSKKLTIIVCSTGIGWTIIAWLCIFGSMIKQKEINYSKPVSQSDSLITSMFGNPKIVHKMRADSIQMIIQQFEFYSKEEMVVIKHMANLIKDLREMKKRQ